MIDIAKVTELACEFLCDQDLKDYIKILKKLSGQIAACGSANFDPAERVAFVEAVFDSSERIKEHFIVLNTD